MNRRKVSVVVGCCLIGAIAVSAFGYALCALAADRVEAARKDRGESVKKMVADAGLTYPPHQVLVRVFKQESEIEVWGRDKGGKTFKKISAYPVCSMSGKLGPKRKQGDLQVPEGVYRVNVFNPVSSFHLSMGINYPNKSDRILGDKHDPGGEIFIHGACVSIGCVSIEDDPIEEAYLIGWDSKNKSGLYPSVHIHPCRYGAEECKEALALLSKDNEELSNLWSDLSAIHSHFAKHKALPEVTIDGKGRYNIGE